MSHSLCDDEAPRLGHYTTPNCHLRPPTLLLDLPLAGERKIISQPGLTVDNQLCIIPRNNQMSLQPKNNSMDLQHMNNQMGHQPRNNHCSAGP